MDFRNRIVTDKKFDLNEGILSQIIHLREELQEKDRELQKKDNDLYLAGKFGNELLETNSSLNKQLETLTQESNRKIEVFII